MTFQAQVFSPDWGIGASGLHDLASFFQQVESWLLVCQCGVLGLLAIYLFH